MVTVEVVEIAEEADGIKSSRFEPRARDERLARYEARADRRDQADRRHPPMFPSCRAYGSARCYFALRESHASLRFAAPAARDGTRGSTISDVVEGGGVPIDTSCREGICGTCIAPVRDGVPDHRDYFLTAEVPGTDQRVVDRAVTYR